MSLNASSTNAERASAAWGSDMPVWVRLLATACDADNQRVVGERLGKSSGYISRVLSRTYAGSYEEAERLVRATYGGEDVDCPLFGPIPLASCLRARRRKGPARNHLQKQYAATCPTCSNNNDGGDA